MDADDIGDLSGSFTISAWIKSDSGNVNVDIVSKRDAAPFTQGYALRIDGSGYLQGIWKNNLGVNQIITSNTQISTSVNIWRHVALIYDSGSSTASLYIDGVLDNTATLNGPTSNAQHLLIGAGDYLSDKAEYDLATMEFKKIETKMSQTSSDASDEINCV